MTDSAENMINHASDFNTFWHIYSHNDEMIESFINSIRTRYIDRLTLDEGPEDEEFGRRVAQSLTSNARITEIWLFPSRDAVVRDVMQWLTPSTAEEASKATLAPFTNLATMLVNGSKNDIISVDVWDLIFRLLLTSTSLQKLCLSMKLKSDRVLSALAQYLRAATRVSLLEFSLDTPCSLSEADFVSLCDDGVAGSQLRKLRLGDKVFDVAYVETAAESLSRAIAESSLEEVVIKSRLLFCLALLHTQPVRNLDFAISSDVGIDGNGTRMKINRNWKPLVSASTIPLGMWPQILEKAHTSRETSHGPAGILFYILRERPDLVP